MFVYTLNNSGSGSGTWSVTIREAYSAVAAGTGLTRSYSSGTTTLALTSDVQTSLGKADTALQSVPSTYRTALEQDAIDATLIPKPSSPATGAFLVWDGTAWVAQTLATWQGGNY